MRQINMCKGYLDNAATSRYKPFPVLRAVNKELRASANPGRGGHRNSINAAMTIEDCRKEVRRLTGMPNVVFTKNCTEALNLALFGMKLSGEVITTVFEHNSVLRPLKCLESEGKLSLRIIRPAGCVVTYKDIAPYLNSSTSLIVISEVSNVTGARHGIEDICAHAKAKCVPVLLDCAQSMGHTDADYSDADLIASSGHKGLHGPQGTGFLAFRDIKISPLLYGGTGTDSYNLVQPHGYPEGLESGTQNTCGIAGLSAGIKWTLAHKAKTEAKTKALATLLLDGLKRLDGIKIYFEGTSGVVCFNVHNLPSSEVADILDTEYNISVRAGLHCAPLAHRYLGTEKQGGVRVSIGCGNTVSDINNLLSALEEILSRHNINIKL